jgi:glutathione synthase/RimK-type ligase-like ATP-grasp enzyme
MQNTLDLFVIASPEGRRARAIQNSLHLAGLPPARMFSWLEVLQGIPLEQLIFDHTIIKLESPAEDWETEKALLEFGDIPDPDGDYLRVTGKLEYELGAFYSSRQWYLGFCRALDLVKSQLEALGKTAINHPDDIAIMFDKRATHAMLEGAGIPVPPALPPVRNFAELEAQMTERGWKRVFVKLAHGSGAAGAIALETHRGAWQATSTVEMASGNRLYNSRRLWTYRHLEQVVRLVDLVCQHRVHVEQWLPKATFQNRIFDLRVVMVAGQPKQVLVRSSRGTITNLHLGNERGDWAAVRQKIGDTVWERIVSSCQEAVALFPRSLYSGVDVLLQPDWQQHAILELNAFGDYHRNVLVDGLDTYQTQLQALGKL